MKQIKSLMLFLFVFVLSACGGSSSGGSSSGKLVADFRANGLSSEYEANEGYKALVDAFLEGMKEIVVEIDTAIKWGVDIPVVFSGCGTENAFFSSASEPVSMHAGLGLADPETVFGPDVVSQYAVVYCHELTERALQTFMQDSYTATIGSLFGTDLESTVEGYVYSALVFELQVLFHELGHGLDKVLIKDSVDNTTKLQNFAIPIANQCNQVGCDTISEDFADWIAAYLLTEAMKEEFAENANDALKFAAGFIVASSAWPDIMGAGGDVAHGYTEARQANILCYTYGGLPELREADANSLNYQLANVLAAYGLDSVTCENTYQANATATTTLLGSYISL